MYTVKGHRWSRYSKRAEWWHYGADDSKNVVRNINEYMGGNDKGMEHDIGIVLPPTITSLTQDGLALWSGAVLKLLVSMECIQTANMLDS
jgi:hypothetical protein